MPFYTFSFANYVHFVALFNYQHFLMKVNTYWFFNILFAAEGSLAKTNCNYLCNVRSNEIVVWWKAFVDKECQHKQSDQSYRAEHVIEKRVGGQWVGCHQGSTDHWLAIVVFNAVGRQFYALAAGVIHKRQRFSERGEVLFGRLQTRSDSMASDALAVNGQVVHKEDLFHFDHCVRTTNFSGVLAAACLVWAPVQ